MKSQKLSLFVASILVMCLFSFVSGCDGSILNSTRRYSSHVIGGSPKREIIIYEELFSEVTVSYYYSIMQDNSEIIPKCYFDGRDPDDSPTYDLISCNSGDLVGIVETAKPEAFLILHEFSTGLSYPHMSNAKVAKPLIYKMRKALTSSTYIVADDPSL